MKIGIDISQTAFQGTGVARYTSRLVSALLQYDKNNDYTLFYSSLRKPLPDEFNLMPSTIRQFKFPPTLLDIIWNRLHIVPIERFIGKVDVFFSSDWVEPPADAKKITTIHDLIALKFPQTAHNKTDINFQTANVKANIVKTQKRKLDWVKKESKMILCDSMATKRDAEELLGIESARLQVIYPAVVNSQSVEAHKIAQFLQKLSVDKPFILTVGTLSPRKNMNRLIAAFNQAQLKDVELYIVGAEGWDIPSSIHQSNIHFLGFVSDEELQSLYKEALFFILPSLYEGFGYPLVEAMINGCPTAASNTSSLEEIGRDSSYLFDPYSIDDIAKTIIELASHKKLRDELVKKGLRKATEFSSENFAHQLLKIINAL